MQTIKKLLKRALTFMHHPIFTLWASKHGAKNFVMGNRTRINSFQGLIIGNNVSIGTDSRFLLVSHYHGGHYNPEISIGDGVSIENRFSALSAAPITIGNHCLIASDVMISFENHGMNPENTNSYAELPLESKSVKIGDGCWIGEKACVCPGVELGERCIVAAGAVVAKSFPAFSLVGGVPAKMIKQYNSTVHKWEHSINAQK